MKEVINIKPPEHAYVKTFYGMFSDLDHLEDEHQTDRKSPCAPATNIYETDSTYFIDMALPGYQRQDIQLKREDDLITVCAETHTVRHKKLQRFFRQEFLAGSFTRSFLLPDDAGEAIAKFADGVLCIQLDKNRQWMAAPTVVQAITIQ
ncbi:Hsp20/alpha crystallin family protein [Pseudobacter ginsenosidimutans]|uniref:HSP20 family protein n=1 Tax=Pseudobacter ginsenosidimutans TaxID=661488 RepID=A0A4Q7MYS4_9BACT|nr:Hsp20/alpha crystallin family protein [Pseudobacter ginsenosidimutans]RZS74397.1 HSP20 family protein [Pseudobacter ginsenosidimutans]